MRNEPSLKWAEQYISTEELAMQDAEALRAAGDELAAAYLYLRNWIAEGFPEMEVSEILFGTDTALRRWREVIGKTRPPTAGA